MKKSLLVVAALAMLAAPVFAHGGVWRGPAWPSPGLRTPRDPGGPPDPGLPTPGPGDPARTPGSAPVPPPDANPNPPPAVGTPRPARPREGVPTSTEPALGHWSYWWHLNRERILDLRALQTGRLANRTESPRPFFLGEGDTGGEDDPAREAVRAALVAELIEATRDSDDDVASGAVIALGKAADPVAIPRLIEIVGDPGADPTVSESAALALGMIGEGGAEVRSFLLSVVSDRKARTRTRAFAALGLGYFGDPGAIPALAAAARAEEATREVNAAALLALGLLGDPILVPDLGSELAGRTGRKERDDLLRAYRAAALGLLRSRAAIPSLLLALRDDDPDVRRQAVLSLGAVAAREDTEVVKTLLYVLGADRDGQVRGFAAVTLGEIGAPAAGDALLYTYRKGDGPTVPYAALGLALLARNAEDPAVGERIVPLLRAQFKERGNNDLRGALAVALGIVRDRGAVAPLLRELTSGGDPELRAHVAIALGLIGDFAAAPALRDALGDSTDPGLKREAALALGLLGDGEAVSLLTDLVRNANTEYVRGSAAVALGRLATPEAAEALREVLADASAPGTTRAFTAVALGLVLDRRPLPILSRIGDHLNHRMATEAIAEVLTIL